VPLTGELQKLVELLAVTDDPQEKIALLVDRAAGAPPLAPSERVPANRVPGCVSIVWLTGELRGGRCHFRGDAESPVVRALVILLCDVFSGLPPGAIARSNLDPLDTLGLARNLSPTRRHGLAALQNAIRAFAARHVDEDNPS
jgi:cysteine desulfuration protein SufE